MGKIETALLSVYDKTGIVDFARELARMKIGILASGGTHSHLKAAGIDCREISELTGRVDYLGGLVKTLHPAIHAGILARRDRASHMEELRSLGWEKIDMVVVNFYEVPERRMVDLSFIDIGGPAMARASAKNHTSCVPVPHPSWYGRILAELAAGDITPETRWKLATDTITRTNRYDASVLAVVDALAADEVPGETLVLSLRKAFDLRYGENPHQKAGFFTLDGRSMLRVVKGELSYNNLLDLDCCLAQLREFEGGAAVVVKHVCPCGVAEADDGAKALEYAYECDPVSAFGGVVGLNVRFGETCAAFLTKRFVECIVAPGFDEGAMAILAKKKTRLVAAAGEAQASCLVRSALDGVLVQSRDSILLTQDLDFVSGETPGAYVMNDLMFAWKVAKHVRSNAIVFARGGRTLGIGGGQPSRVDSTRIAIMKAGQAGLDLKGSVMASDGFFPFPDSVEVAAEAGVCAVVQPGGSIRDQEVIARARQLGVVMALAFTRHFRH